MKKYKKTNQNPLVKTLKTTGNVLHGAAITNAASAVIIHLFGFTTQGVLASSIAAGIQSSIVVIKSGSLFAYLQSVGALGTGILGIPGLPVIACVLTGGRIVYIVYDNKQAIGDFMKRITKLTGKVPKPKL